MTRQEKAFQLIRQERQRQIAKWGADSSNHPFEWMSILGEEFGELCQAVNETCFVNKTHEERGGTDHIIEEAVQVAAVATALIEDVLKVTYAENKDVQEEATCGELQQVIDGTGQSICLGCIHRIVCRGVENQPCVSCTQYKSGV